MWVYKMISPIQTLALTNPVFSIFDIGKEALNKSNSSSTKPSCDTWLNFLLNYSQCENSIGDEVKNIFFSLVFGFIDIILWIIILFKIINASGIMEIVAEASV